MNGPLEQLYNGSITSTRIILFWLNMKGFGGGSSLVFHKSDTVLTVYDLWHLIQNGKRLNLIDAS